MKIITHKQKIKTNINDLIICKWSTIVIKLQLFAIKVAYLKLLKNQVYEFDEL